LLQCPPTETELLKQQADLKTLSRAEEIMLERQDEAKAMSQMVNACKCVAIRDAQLAERKYMMLENEAENRRLDLMMEQERLKALDNYSQRERQRKEERMQGAKVCPCAVQSLSATNNGPALLAMNLTAPRHLVLELVA
jgi:hypothetical protein